MGDRTIVSQYEVDSDSTPGRTYVVSLNGNGQYSCGCLGWTRHVPRRDCKHIEWVKAFGGRPVDPLLAAMGKAQRRESRKRMDKAAKFNS